MVIVNFNLVVWQSSETITSGDEYRGLQVFLQFKNLDLNFYDSKGDSYSEVSTRVMFTKVRPYSGTIEYAYQPINRQLAQKPITLKIDFENIP